MSQEQWTAVDRYITDTLLSPDAALEVALKTSADAGLPSHDIASSRTRFTCDNCLSCEITVPTHISCRVGERLRRLRADAETFSKSSGGHETRLTSCSNHRGKTVRRSRSRSAAHNEARENSRAPTSSAGQGAVELRRCPAAASVAKSSSSFCVAARGHTISRPYRNCGFESFFSGAASPSLSLPSRPTE